MFLTLCFTAWGSCLAVLAYQTLMMLVHGSWSPLSLADVTVHLLDVIRHLPFEWGFKLAYVFITTEFSLALWWTGVFFCCAQAALKLLRR